MKDLAYRQDFALGHARAPWTGRRYARLLRPDGRCRVLALPAIYINGGSRGFLVRIAPEALVRLLAARPVDVAIAR